MADPAVPTYVISLEHADSRRQQVTREFQSIGLDFQFYDGVDGRQNLNALLEKTDQDAWRRNMGSPVSAGHLGCYASHVNLWQDIGAGNDKIVLVCEDDVAFKDDFKVALQLALENQADWDICRFAIIRAKGPLRQKTVGQYSLNAYWGPFTGNACYLIKRDVAARLAAGFWPITRAHDHELNRFFVHDIRLMGLEPFAAHPNDGGQSFITGTAMAKNTKLPRHQRLGYYRLKAANYFRRFWWLARRGYVFSRPKQ